MSCTLRPWQPDDAPALAAALSNPHVLDRLRDGIPYPYARADAADYISAMCAADADSIFAFAVEADGKAVGSITAFRQSNIHVRTAELGYYLAEPY